MNNANFPKTKVTLGPSPSNLWQIRSPPPSSVKRDARIYDFGGREYRPLEVIGCVRAAPYRSRDFISSSLSLEDETLLARLILRNRLENIAVMTDARD